MPDPVTFSVGAEGHGQRLDTILAAHPQIASRSAAARLIEAGRVSVDGVVKQKRHRVSVGERVEASPAVPEMSLRERPDASAPRLAVPFEDEWLMVVDKPSGLVVHPAPGHPSGTLVQLLALRSKGGADSRRPGIVHRLDRDTSGLMVVAKEERVHAALQDAIRARALRREYLALVDGRPDARSGTIDAPIGRDRRERTIHSTRTDRPRSARTHFEIEHLYPRVTLLRVRLETGRTHQIRVHLAAIDHPVCGDRQYGGGGCGQRLGLARQFLHSCRLSFIHPITRETIACESNLPVELRRASDAAVREPVPEGPDGD